MSAVEMARLIRAKKLSAREALAAHLTQIERVNPKVNAIVTLVPEMAAAAAAKADEMQARGETLGAAARSARRAQGSAGNPRHPHDLWIAALQGQHPHRGRHRRRTDAARGRDHDRQDQHAGIRLGIADVQHGLRRDAQSLRPDEDLWRIVRRRRRRAGLRARACRQRLRYRRLAPQSRRILQRGGLSAFPRPRAQPEEPRSRGRR